MLDVCIDAGNPAADGGGASGVSVGPAFAHPAVVAGGGGAAGLGCDGGNGTCFLVVSSCCTGGNAGIQGGSGEFVPNTQQLYNFEFTGGTGGTATAAGPGGISPVSGQSGGGGAVSGAGGPGGGGGDFDGGLSGTDNNGVGPLLGGAGYTGGGSGADYDYRDNWYFSGGGGGSDYCAPLTPSRSDAKLPSKFSTSGCKIIAGAGTQTTSGTAKGDAEVIITSIVVTQPPVAAITWPFMDERFVTSGTASRAGALSSLPAPGAGAYPPIAKFSCIRGAHAARIKSCTAVVTTDPGSRIRAPKTRAITNGQTLPASTGGAYPSYVKDSLTVTAVSRDGKKTKQTDFYYVYIASTYPITPPGIHPTP